MGSLVCPFYHDPFRPYFRSFVGAASWTLVTASQSVFHQLSYPLDIYRQKLIQRNGEACRVFLGADLSGHENPSADSNLSQINPVHTLLFLQVLLNIITVFTLSSTECSYPSGFAIKILCAFLISFMHAPERSNEPCNPWT
jgi:hypothetical protein